MQSVRLLKRYRATDNWNNEAVFSAWIVRFDAAAQFYRLTAPVILGLGP
jgi:hypothetical protein